MSCALHLITASPMTEHYCRHWLAALERLVTAKGQLGREALQTRKEAWAEAYRHTPHGQPVKLAKLGPGGADA